MHPKKSSASFKQRYFGYIFVLPSLLGCQYFCRFSLARHERPVHCTKQIGARGFAGEKEAIVDGFGEFFDVAHWRIDFGEKVGAAAEWVGAPAGDLCLVRSRNWFVEDGA
jgi:hypothetical protein